MSRMCASVLVFVFFLLVTEGGFRTYGYSADKDVSGSRAGNEAVVGSELRAFTPPSEGNTRIAVRQIYVIFGIVGIGFVVALVLIYLFYEPSYAQQSYKPTQVRRSENFNPYQRSSSEHEID